MEELLLFVPRLVFTDILGVVLLPLRLIRLACPLFCLTGVLDFRTLLEVATCALLGLGEFDRDGVAFRAVDRDGEAFLVAGCCFVFEAVCLTAFFDDCFTCRCLPLDFSFPANAGADIIRNINSQNIIIGVIAFLCFLSVNMAKLLSLAVFYRFETPFQTSSKPFRQL
ncbi:MAG: hypothetical protein ACYTBP_15625 [Planctomycetota bacterium]